MIRKWLALTFCTGFLLQPIMVFAVPTVTGKPVIVQHLGKVDWPQDDPVTAPYLTQFSANDINDLHGDVTCDLIISTPGNYHMALKDAMKGRSDLDHTGLQQQVKDLYDATICWSTSPPVSLQQVPAANLQFKNVNLKGRPALAMGPGGVMDKLVSKKLVDSATRQPFLRNKGNVILVRKDKAKDVKNICDLQEKDLRIVTPNPDLEAGSFRNFSGTIFNVADQNDFGCKANKLFNSIFSQDISDLDLTAFKNPYDIEEILEVFDDDVKWVASSRIMHRDIPYALCHNEADAGVIFYHQAIYLKHVLGLSGCDLEIVPLGGTESNPSPLPGNRVGTLHIAKVAGDFSKNVLKARNLVYDFLTTNPVWSKILKEHGMVDPTP